MKNKIIHLRIASDSMTPLLKVGDEIQYEKINDPYHDLKRFDVLLFSYQGKLMCHYLWKMGRLQKNFITRSLKNFHEEDMPVRASDILGRILYVKIPWHLRLRIILRTLFSPSR